MVENETTSVSVPGYLTLFGDHAVNFGEPAIALAVEPRFVCNAQVSNKYTVNDEELEPLKHPQIRGALLQGWTDMDTPVSFQTRTSIPSGLGLCTTPLTVACLGALSMLHNHVILEEVAKKAFEVEYDIMNRSSSPLGPITLTYGSTIILKKQRSENFLWVVQKDQKKWFAHQNKKPDMQFVLGYSGIDLQTNQMVDKVRRFYNRNAFARDIINDIGQISLDGEKALKNNDIEEVGRLMTENQKLLVTLGVNHPMLEKLNNVVLRHSYGSKITGPGGGCILALTDTPEKVSEAIRQVGGTTYQVTASKDGIKLEDE
jgi:mevalonate kinase